MKLTTHLHLVEPVKLVYMPSWHSV